MNILILLSGIITGILAASFGASMAYGAAIIFIAAGINITLNIYSKTPSKAHKTQIYHFIWIFLLFFGISLINTDMHRPFRTEGLKNIKYVTGNVSAVSYLTSGEKLTLNIDRISNGKEYRKVRNFQIFAYTDGADVHLGDEIALPVQLFMLNEREDNSILSKSDFSKGPFYATKISHEDINIIGKSHGPAVLASELRDRIAIKIENSNLERGTAEFLISILLGDRSLLSPVSKSYFEAAGISHILALSGMHVAILISIILLLLFPLRFFGKTKLLYCLAIIFIWLYCFLTGMSSSTMRAALMTTFLLTALMLQRKKSSLNALLASVAVILIFSPYDLYDIGLQLSFICVAAIIIFVPNLNPIDISSRPRLHNLISLVLISIVTTFATWAFISYYFKNVPLLFLPANLLLLPVLPWFMGIGILYLFFCFIGWEPSLLTYLLDITYQMLFLFCRKISLTGSQLHIQVEWHILALWFLGLIICAIGFLSIKMRKVKFGAVAILSLTLILTPFSIQSTPPSLCFNKDYQQIRITQIKENGKKEQIFPRNKISQFKDDNIEIISLDCPYGDLTSLLNPSSVSNVKRFLILGAGAKDIAINEFENLDQFDKIFIHPSISKKKEKEIIQSLLEKDLPVHSLRTDGSLELPL